MPEPHPLSTDHAEFDAYCAGVEDWQTLPEPAPEAPADVEPDAEGEFVLDEQILAGLVTPW